MLMRTRLTCGAAAEALVAIAVDSMSRVPDLSPDEIWWDRVNNEVKLRFNDSKTSFKLIFEWEMLLSSL